jgi:exo-beta-1,3-glucanase (GH17 family)
MRYFAGGFVFVVACSGQGGSRPAEQPMVKEPPVIEEVPPRGPCDDVLAEIGVPKEVPLKACSTKAGARCLPEADLHRLGVAYSGYRTGQSPKLDIYPELEQIREDLGLLLKRGYSWIRLFDSSTHAERVLQVIREDGLDMKVSLGVWIEGPKATQDARNQADVARGVQLAKAYEDIVIAVSVGNETLDDWSSVRTPPADLAEYIEQVRQQVAQPVTTDDMYPPYQMTNQYTDVVQVVEAIDYVSLHVYAFIDAQWSWDWKQETVPAGAERSAAMMAAGLDFTKAAVRGVREAMQARGIDLPIVIGEAGWKSSPTKPGESGEQFRAHPLNQQQYYRGFMSWVAGPGRDQDSPEAALYFEAFDEPWKGIDDAWGLFDVARHPKFVVSCSYPELAPSGPTEYSAADALYFQ